ncbi:MAG: hypothetical protein MJ214_03280 [Bacilli bacterium]|nr:hypothetical protein [Bacilli bacterium]
MRKIGRLAVLTLALPFTTSCNGNACTLEINAKFCTVEGLKETYNSGEKVHLKVTPYPYFELPPQKDIAIHGASDFDYDYANGEISFNINTNATLVINGVSSFGGQEIGYVGAQNWWNHHKGGYEIAKLHYQYSFEEVEDPTSPQYQLVLGLINSIFKLEPDDPYIITNFAGDITEYYPDNIQLGVSGKWLIGTHTLCVANNQSTLISGPDQLAVYFDRIQATTASTIDAIGYMHWIGSGSKGGCDSVQYTVDNVVVDFPLEDGSIYHSDPISGFVQIDLTFF